MVEEEILLDNKLLLVGSKNSMMPGLKDPKIVFSELPMIYREQGSATRSIMESFFERSKIIVGKKIELTSNEAVKQAIIAGLGCSIMPLIGIRNEIKNEDISIIPMDGFPIITKWRLIWLKNKKLSPLNLAYLNYLRDSKVKIAEDHFPE
jgi:DNA-binding transcriptional LysR family regulator